jgi:hypothetical protein
MEPGAPGKQRELFHYWETQYRPWFLGGLEGPRWPLSGMSYCSVQCTRAQYHCPVGPPSPNQATNVLGLEFRFMIWQVPGGSPRCALSVLGPAGIRGERWNFPVLSWYSSSWNSRSSHSQNSSSRAAWCKCIADLWDVGKVLPGALGEVFLFLFTQRVTALWTHVTPILWPVTLLGIPQGDFPELLVPLCPAICSLASATFSQALIPLLPRDKEGAEWTVSYLHRSSSLLFILMD